MKTKLLLLFPLMFSGFIMNAQNGLDSLILEKYYIATVADAAAADADATGAGYATGVLPAGSVTYRIYIQMKPGYKFEALYGNIPHPLRINTTTTFYNNSGGGNTPTWSRNSVKNTSGNILALDSWFTVGGAATNAYGMLKTEDSSYWGPNLFNVVSGGVMQNNNLQDGIPVTIKDGYCYSGFAPSSLPAPQSVTYVGLTTELNVFTDGSTVGNSFMTTNGSVACLNGAVGPAATNRVLLGQFTTNGKFCYEFNIQIGTPSGGTQQYVAQNPTGNEIQLPSMANCLSVATDIQNAVTPSGMLFDLYPNPANEILTLDIANGKDVCSYTLLNVLGSELVHKKLDMLPDAHKETIDISALPAGVYFMQVNSNTGSKTRRFVKK
ncbi:MAG: T9SS type A sorting domain-containing protein [Bacteroidia bacterium]